MSVQYCQVVSLCKIYDRFTDSIAMPGAKKSPIWEYFEVDDDDESTANCKVPGCKDKKVGRGNKETKKYNTTNLITHLKKHRVDYEKYCSLKMAKDSTDKRKREAEDEEGEDDEDQMESTSSGRLRNKKDREVFIKKQSSLPSTCFSHASQLQHATRKGWRTSITRPKG